MTLFKITGWLFTFAAFSLISSNIKFAKPFDVLILLTGLLVIFQKPAWSALGKLWLSLRPYFFYLLLLFAFVFVGQLTSHYAYGIPIDRYSFAHLARVVFNGGVFIFSAFLIYFFRKEKILARVNWAIFLSPALIAPIFIFNKLTGYYLDGGRLKGLLITAVIFGIWTMISFLLGIGIFAAASKIWKKLLVVTWLGVIAGMLLWSGSRASWIATILGTAIWIAVYALQKKNIKTAVAITAAFFVSFSIGYTLLNAAWPETKEYVETRAVNLIKNPMSGQDHVAFWHKTLNFSLEHPFGFGYSRFNISKSPSADVSAADEFIVPRSTNTILEIWIAGGLGAAIVALFISLKLLGGAYYAIKNANLDAFSLSWLIILPVFLFDIFFTDGFLHRHIWFISGTILGTILINKPAD